MRLDIPRLALFLAYLLLAPQVHAETFAGRVVRVVDGDTLVVLVASPRGRRHEEKTRLAGIDAPESGQAWEQRAKQALSGFVFGRDVTVDWAKRDRYGRTVGKILGTARM